MLKHGRRGRASDNPILGKQTVNGRLRALKQVTISIPIHNHVDATHNDRDDGEYSDKNPDNMTRLSFLQWVLHLGKNNQHSGKDHCGNRNCEPAVMVGR